MVAVRVMLKTPACDGVPESVPVPVPAPPANETPVGSPPVWVIVGVGPPVAVILKVPATPTVKVVDVAVVIAGGAMFTGVKVVVPDAPLDPATLVATVEQVYGVPVVRPVMEWLRLVVPAAASVPPPGKHVTV